VAKKNMKIRLDQALIERGLALDPKQAQALIMAGQVLVNEQRAAKPGDMIREDARLRLKPTRQFVSRGGDKLLGALQDFGLVTAISGAVAIDVGASTGGFTDCLLQMGAAKVYAIDVGTNQLAWRLRQDSRVEVMEKTDIRAVAGELDAAVRWVVADVSFNSLSRLLPNMLIAAPGVDVHFLLLIKPQFELQGADVPPGGVVSDAAARERARQAVARRLTELGLTCLGLYESRVLGRMGNQESFVLARRS
jgi:23S rRNA (cytidine1920-2'-O)/16S rRNA (cytidine1409-2'-O)-methyltransferase